MSPPFVRTTLNGQSSDSIGIFISNWRASFASKAATRAEYTLLKQVTHWTPEEVLREARTKARKDIHPTHILSASLSEILAQLRISKVKTEYFWWK
jgi:antitoxin component of MazEF toxin-antitoxin module